MTTTQMTDIESEIQAIVDTFDRDCYGLRSDDNAFGVGDVLDFCSRRYEDGGDTDEIHDGVCATMVDGNSDGSVVRALQRHGLGRLANPAQRAYSGKHLYLLGSDSCDAGDDIGEIVMRNPTVIAVFEVRQ